MNYYDRYESEYPTYKNPLLRKFDIDVGDRVKHTIRRRCGSNDVEMMIYTYTVKAIYPYVILCENRWGEKTTFTKVDYQTGVIHKCEE